LANHARCKWQNAGGFSQGANAALAAMQDRRREKLFLKSRSRLRFTFGGVFAASRLFTGKPAAGFDAGDRCFLTFCDGRTGLAPSPDVSAIFNARAAGCRPGFTQRQKPGV